MRQFSALKYSNTPILYTTDAHFYNPSVKIGSIPFFLSSDLQEFHHLLGRHATGINSSLIFFKCFAFFKLSMLDKNVVLIRLKIKAIYLKKNISE